MPRPDFQSADAIGRHPGLDVLTQAVGMLILFVVVAGLQLARSPDADPKPESEELLQLKNTAKRLEDDVLQIAAQTQLVQSESAAAFMERSEVSTMLAAARREIALRREALDEAARRQFDSDRALAQAKAQLNRLKEQRAQVSDAPAPTVKIESYPTPLSKTVDEKELHFQLRAGRLAAIPMEELLTRFKTVAQSKVGKLRDQPEFTDILGPIEGFHMRYTLERRDIPWENTVQGPRGGGTVIRLQRWELLPVSNELGETIDAALSSQSVFRAKLDGLRPRDWTVTIWVYPDSFEAFRRIRKELYQLGFAVAGRPLPEDLHIAGSPDGSKSAAE